MSLFGSMPGSVSIPEGFDLTEPTIKFLQEETPPKLDYFAELYVAGRFAHAGWNVYFPHRDNGFDFIISKGATNGDQILRPVQVKGKYPTAEKSDKPTYGFVGDLSQLHPEMVLVIPYFRSETSDMPVMTAYMPRSLIRDNSRGFRCEPALFKEGLPAPRRDYRKFFDGNGLGAVENQGWSASATGP